ncbi:hypothetical protein DRJ19_01620 [Candidatus Woesearchaeota archaeon]|nr:MAG: hypothetical protein DRJ19_01620 [Candidatus Woesearchaeota archaeon]
MTDENITRREFMKRILGMALVGGLGLSEFGCFVFEQKEPTVKKALEELLKSEEVKMVIGEQDSSHTVVAAVELAQMFKEPSVLVYLDSEINELEEGIVIGVPETNKAVRRYIPDSGCLAIKKGDVLVTLNPFFPKQRLIIITQHNNVENHFVEAIDYLKNNWEYFNARSVEIDPQNNQHYFI